MAIKDKLFNTTALWVPSGDNKTQNGKVKGGNNKYRNSRILCAAWVYGSTAAMIGMSAWRIVQGFHFYNYLPMIALDAFTVFTTFRFIWFTS